MRRTILPILIIIVIIIAIVIVLARNPNSNNGSNNSNHPVTTSNQSSNNNATAGTVNIRDMMFTPSQITVQKGATVTWTNNDSTTHTVIDDLSNVGGPHSGDIAPGQTYSFTFNKTGSYQYHCSIHPSMRGTIVVR